MGVVVSVFIVFVVVMVLIQIGRARTHGPRVKWIPRRWRPRVNDYYQRHGWPEPYDSEGTRLSWWRKSE